MLKYSPPKSLLFFITTLLKEPRVKSRRAKFPDSNGLQKNVFLQSAFTHFVVCQTTSFFVPKALACWSHLFLLDCKSPSSLETLCVHLFPCRAQHVLAHLNISMFSELAWDKNVMARAGLSLSLCQLGGFCFAQLRSAVFVQT